MYISAVILIINSVSQLLGIHETCKKFFHEINNRKPVDKLIERKEILLMKELPSL